MEKSQKKQLAAKIIVFVFVLLILAGMLYDYSSFVEKERDNEVEQQISEVYSQVNRQFSNFTRRSWEFLYDCSVTFKLMDDDVKTEEFINSMQNVQKFDSILFINGKGEWISHDGKNGSMELDEELNKVISGGERIITDIKLCDENPHEVNFMCAIPVDESAYKGFSYNIIAVIYNQDRMMNVLDKTMYDGNARCYVLQSDGEILLSMQSNSSHSQSFYPYLQETEIKEKDYNKFKSGIENGEKGLVRYTYEGVDKYLFYQPMGYKDWMMCSIIEKSAIGQYTTGIVSRTTIMTAISVALMLLGVIVYMIYRGKTAKKKANEELEYRNQLFDIMSRNTNNVFITAKPGEMKAEYVSPNIYRAVGLKPEELMESIPGAAAKIQDEQSIETGKKNSRGLKLGESTSFMVNRRHFKTGKRLYIEEVVHHVKIGSRERYIFFMIDRTDEYEHSEQLKAALEVATAANASKSAFLSNMSHDIRTPMNVILGFLPLLERDADNPEKVREYKAKISASGNHLMTLINDVLDMSKIESGKSSVDLIKTRTSVETEKIITLIRHQATAKHQKLRVLVKDVHTEYIECDSVKINRILISIMSNAVKYTPEGGNITYTVQELPCTNPSLARLRFIISDDGIGMSEEFQQTIFDTFSRENNESTGEERGTGLGMAIVKSLVDLLGGNITVSSEKGKGSTFIVDLSVKVDKTISYAEFWNSHNIHNALIIDDEQDICENAVNSAIQGGLNMEYSVGGIAAIEKIQAAIKQDKHYDLIIIDCCMPGMDGFEVVQKIREICPADKQPMLLITAFDRSRGEMTASKSGADGYVLKPFFLPVLKETIEEIRQTQKRHDEGDTAPAKAPATGQLPTDKFPDLRVLVVEDYEINAEVLCASLELFEVSCDTASNGKEAVDILEANDKTYDLILMDIQMPIMNGYDATKAIRASDNPKVRDIPIIAMSANAFAEDMQKAYNVGMNEYVTKPIDLVALENALSRVQNHMLKNER